jgi:hypothetical protein
MEQQQRLEVYEAQTKNVRALKAAWAQLNRQINACLRRRDDSGLETNTKFLAVLYCALSEASFSKLIHTPHGLELQEIEQVKAEARDFGVKHGWLKCAGLAVRRIEGVKHNHPSNVLKKVSELIDAYIFEPSRIRNKLAHGQWSVALNRENDAVNYDLTNEIGRLDVVELHRREHALDHLETILEDIVESPNKAHRRDYWVHLTAFEERQQVLAGFTLEEKRKRLVAKTSHANSHADGGVARESRN